MKLAGLARQYLTMFWLCLFGIASPEWGYPGLLALILWTHSDGQSNIILPILNIFTYIYVIQKLICDILYLNLGKIQLQFTALYFASIFAGARHEPHLSEDNSPPTAHAQRMGYI